MRKRLLIAALLTLPALTQAANVRFLGNSIFAQLSDKDAAAIKASVAQALDEEPDQSRTVWHNEKGDIRIAITPKLSYELDGQTCRRTELRMAGDHRANERYVFELCKTEQGWAFSPSPLNSYSDKDREIFSAHLQDTLESGVDGVPATWINPQTGNSAVVVPLRTVPAAGKQCREAAVSLIDSRKRTVDGRYTFCRSDDGAWERAISGQ
ncbi:hypothetical protein GCM10011348_05650 [Marinobacterium nitratireducens]|uniref:Surface antigen domain-containing protein n=1 Tax=Marinobacterium nitratireducens TaxID=518897 RepID=A0A918DPK0_9GAMM|nr:hypothetical protein [Marinobacterium nitratireducens]GGO77025.1 hypothetical protein GCM10011348_05650 [Marinobacterium nitratireducens]